MDFDSDLLYSPVCSWSTIRLMLVLSIVLSLVTVQVDYTSAFVQAPIKDEVFVEMPQGFRQSGKVLKLKKSLYGLKQAPRNFFEHLRGKLEGVGLRQCTNLDPCLFVSDKVIAVNYVDDTLFFSPKMEYIEDVMRQLRDEGGLDLEKEDDVAEFLGVSISKLDDGNILMTQSGLAIKVVEALKIEKLPRKFTPAERTPLVKDEGGDPPELRYNYASVVGMLQYLQGHSRPDITFAVSQVARYTHNPKKLHEFALERIGQYLKGTINKGLIFKPTESFKVAFLLTLILRACGLMKTNLTQHV